MEEKFQDLESSITKQLINIRNMILNLEERLEEHGDTVVYNQKKLSSSLSKTCPGSLSVGNGGNYLPNLSVLTYLINNAILLIYRFYLNYHN